MFGLRYCNIPYNLYFYFNQIQRYIDCGDEAAAFFTDILSANADPSDTEKRQMKLRLVQMVEEGSYRMHLILMLYSQYMVHLYTFY